MTPELSNIRDFLGWLVGRRVVDITAGDPPGVPDADEEDQHYIVLHFDNGGTLDVPIGDQGFDYNNPDGDDGAADPSARDEEEGSHVINDALISHAEQYPWRWAPQNPYYVKSHTSAPGTVRQWFRAMRAADFARALPTVVEFHIPHWDARGECCFLERQTRDVYPDGWTLIDTQKVVDRETAAHYLAPDLSTIYFVQGGRVVGSIENVSIERSAYAPLPAAGLLDGLGDSTWFGVDRSMYPQFSAKVPASRGALTLHALRMLTCSRCAGPVRIVGSPMGYVGSSAGNLLYLYADLVSADTRYQVPDGPLVKLCDTCRYGELVYRGDPVAPGAPRGPLP